MEKDSRTSSLPTFPLSKYKKGLLLFAFTVLWVALTLLPVALHRENEICKVLSTVMAMIPLPIVVYFLFKNIIVVVLNSNPEDDKTINLVEFVLTVISWVGAWSLIYYSFWVWNPDFYPTLPFTESAYKVWCYFALISTGLTVTDSPTFAESENEWISLIQAVHALSSYIITAGIFAIIIAIILENNHKITSHHSHSSTPSTSTSSSSSSSIFEQPVDLRKRQPTVIFK